MERRKEYVLVKDYLLFHLTIDSNYLIRTDAGVNRTDSQPNFVEEGSERENSVTIK